MKQKHLLVVTNPINPAYYRDVIVTGDVTQSHIDRAIETLDDSTPLGLVPDSKADYYINISPYKK